MRHRTSRGLAALLLPLSLAAGLASRDALGQAPPPCVVAPPAVTAAGGTVALWAGACTLTLPDATAVTMWGFGASAAAIGIPGPAIVVPPGTASLQVTLTNALPEDVSIVIPGLTKPMAPVITPDANGHPRVHSFDAVAAANGGSQSWTWANPKAGTFLYQSGAHPGVQVQMGLYGAATVQAAAGQVYTGVGYDKEVVLVLSEIDPRFHAAVAAGRYGAPVPAVLPPGLTAADYPSSPIGYYPRYFLVNGAPYAPGSAIASDTAGAPLAANDAILLRLLNAGLRTHTMTIFAPTPATTAPPAPYLSIVAEDGNRYPYAKTLYDVFLPAGKTADALFSAPAGGVYKLQDRTLAVTNGAAVGDAGLQAALSIGAGTGPVAAGDAYTMAGNTTLTVPAPGVLANDTSGTAMTAVLVTSTSHGTLALAADGSFSYTPTTGFAGIDAFTYKATNPASSNVATVTITVQLPPTAGNDSYSVVAGTTLAVAAPGVLGNDSSPAGLPLTAVLGTGPAAGALTLGANGSFTYAAPATTGPQTFTYTASDGTLSSAAATVTLNVTAPQPPLAAADSYATTATPTAPSLAVAAPGVLGNDSSPNGLPLTAVLVSPPTKLAGGSFTLNANGSFGYWTKNLTATTDSFTYRASDGTLLSSPTTVTISIAAHPAPVANNDTFSAPRRTTTSYTPVVLNVLANDSATPPSSLVPSSVTILSQPSRGGTVTVNANGTISYSPRRLFSGSDVFTYSVKDDLGATSKSARVTVNVR